MQHSEHVDLLVIGWGKGGKTLAGKLGRAGRRVALVERDPQMVGGTCINVACVPTKALIHDAEARLPEYDQEFWFSRAVARRDKLTAAMRNKNHSLLDTVDSLLLVSGEARFTGPREVTVIQGDDTLVLTADAVVINTGSVPTVPDLAGFDGVFAIGDVKGPPVFTYTSLDDAHIVEDQLTGDGRRTTDRLFPYTVFTSPPLARVGMTTAEAVASGCDVVAVSKQVADIAAMPRPEIDGDARGIISFVVDAETDQVLGAAMMHVNAEEVINLVATAMRHGITASELRDGIYTHPSATEALNEVLGALAPVG